MSGGGNLGISGRIRKVGSICNSIFDVVVVVGYTGGAICLVTICGVTAVGVVMRYILAQPFAFTEELAGAMMVCLGFLPLAYVLRHKGFVNVEFAVNKLPKKARRWLELVALSIALIYCSLLISSTWKLTQNSYEQGTRFITLPFPVFFIQGSMLVGLGILIVGLIVLWVVLIVKETRQLFWKSNIE